MDIHTNEFDMNKIIFGDHHDPFSVLGMHPIKINHKDSLIVRTFLPDAKEACVLNPKNKRNYPFHKTNHQGFFVAFIEDEKAPFPYKIKITNHHNHTWEIYDPYQFLPILTDFDLHLFNEGNNYMIYNRMGAHPTNINNVDGVHFAVWAPNAKRVSVVGDFNNWDGRRHAMRVLGGSGVWEIFIPGLWTGDIYKYEIKAKAGNIFLKADPYGFFGEVRPKTGSRVAYLDNYKWKDQSWMEKRYHTDGLESPLSIYEVHLGSWIRDPKEPKKFRDYRELAHKLVDYVKRMGYTHIELLPVEEHPLDISWGYQVLGYFAATSRFGEPTDFMYFVDHCHKNNIGVLLDWVPGHFPMDAHGLIQFDGTALYEHADPRKGEHPDWGTKIFNYGRKEVQAFLISNAFFWFDKYHIDGLRVDAVASMLYLDYGRKNGEWIPNPFGGKENIDAIEFMKKLNHIVHEKFPGIFMIAEESTAWTGVSRPTYTGGLGFTYKWNMGWMNDILMYMSKDPVYRKYHHNMLTFSLIYAFHENFILVLSHDEIVHGKNSMLGKMPGDTWQKFANVRLLYGYMFAHPGKKLLFMGNDFGQWNEWNCEHSLDWHLLDYESHRKLNSYIRELNHLYQNEKSLFEIDYTYQGFEWIDINDWEGSIISFIRHAKDQNDFIVVICNFTPIVRYNYRIGMPAPGFYNEILNSDSEIWGGSNAGNYGGKWTDEIAFQGRSYSMELTLPPLGVVMLKLRKE